MAHTILYAESHKVVAEAVKDTLEAEGWRVVLCFDGAAAANRLASKASYDLLVFDNYLPHINGLELARYARCLPTRERTPVIMLSAGEAAEEAQDAGVDAFLRKPYDVGLIVCMVRELVTR